MVELIEKFKQDFKEMVGSRNLQEWAKFLAQDDNTAFEVEHTGTLFKLYILFSYAKWPYLKIMSNQREKYHLKLIFIDLYAGSGLNMIKTSEEIYVCGSSLLALFASHIIDSSRQHTGHFDHMVFIDKNQKVVDLLQKRCKIILSELGEKSMTIGTSLSSNARIITTKFDVLDSTSLNDLTKWLDSIWSKHPIHTLIFIDPDRASNFNMKILEKLLRYPGDLFLLLHTNSFVEMVNKERYNSQTIKDMLGINDDAVSHLFKLNKNKEIADFYVKQFETVIKTTQIDKLTKGSKYREIIITTPITTGDNANYYLLFATRKTGGEDSAKWQSAFGALAGAIGKMSEVGKTALEILKGPQKTMLDF